MRIVGYIGQLTNKKVNEECKNLDLTRSEFVKYLVLEYFKKKESEKNK